MMTMMLRGRGRRTGVRCLGNTAGLGTFPGAVTARVTWVGPLVLSPSGQLMSGRVLSIVGPVSSLTVRTPRPTAVRPVRAGPFHRRNQGLRFRGPRTRGFCLGSFGLGRPVAAGTLGGELKRIVRSVDFYGVVHGITFAGFLRRLRRSGGLASCLLSVGLGLSSPRLRQPILANETGTVLSTKGLPFIQAALLSFLLRKCEHPGNLGWDSAEDDRSRDRSAILSMQVRLTKT